MPSSDLLGDCTLLHKLIHTQYIYSWLKYKETIFHDIHRICVYEIYICLYIRLSEIYVCILWDFCHYKYALLNAGSLFIPQVGEPIPDWPCFTRGTFPLACHLYYFQSSIVICHCIFWLCERRICTSSDNASWNYMLQVVIGSEAFHNQRSSSWTALKVTCALSMHLIQGDFIAKTYQSFFKS